jgi:acetolactate synthase-1/2/3 large subunit
MNGGDLLIECLKAQGVRCVFGMPGTQNIQIYDSLLRCGAGAIDHYLVRHEYGASIMADGYARAGGDVGVALTVPGPGASNASTGLLQAFTDCVPVLLLTGQHDTAHFSRDPAKLFHGLDQMSFFEPLTRFCGSARSVADIPRLVEQAFQVLRAPRPGPAMLEFAQDVITADATGHDVPPRVDGQTAAAPDEALLEQAAEAIGAARRPLLLAGNGVITGGARQALRDLAEKLQAPVVATRRGKGALPEDHPLALCNVGGYLGQQALDAADCTIAVGCRFTSIDTNSWSRELPRPLIQLDPEPGEIGREYECDTGVAGDLNASLQSLTDRVAATAGNWSGRLEAWRARFAEQPPLPLLPDIRQALPDDGILSVDVHGIGYSVFSEYPINDPETFIYPCIGVSLGHAFPAALGARLARPDRTVVCFSGDGGFLMGSPELATAMRYGIDVTVVVVNDAALTAIKGSQERDCEGRTIDTELTNPDFVAFARSYGAHAERVDDLGEFRAAFERAMAVQGPALVEVMLQDRHEEVVQWITWLRQDPLRG